MLAARVDAATAATAPEAPAPSRRGEGARAGRVDRREVGEFLNSRQGKALQKQVVRGVFGMLKKRL